MSGFFSRLFGMGSPGKADSAPAFGTETYEGFVIEPRPVNQGGSWNIAGAIYRQNDPDGPKHDFIRADTFSTAEEAARYTTIKARQIIDQMGDRLLKPND